MGPGASVAGALGKSGSRKVFSSYHLENPLSFFTFKYN